MLNAQRQEDDTKSFDLIEQIKFYQTLMESLHYDLELIRSDVILEETLVEEIAMGGDNTRESIDGLRVNVERKLYWLEQVFNKIRRF